jgi:hypothetical protein
MARAQASDRPNIDFDSHGGLTLQHKFVSLMVGRAISPLSTTAGRCHRARQIKLAAQVLGIGVVALLQ